MAKLQSVLTFDGKDDYIDCGKAVQPTTAITIEAWVKSANKDHKGHIVNRGGGWTEDGFSLFLLNKNIRVELQKAGSHRIKDNPCPPSNEWHHIAFTWDNQSQDIITYFDGAKQGNSKKFTYFDGAKQGNSKKFTGPISIPTQSLNIGRNEVKGYYFLGSIADVRIWDKACTEAEIKANMNFRLTGKEDGLVAYYPLNGDALDHSSNDNNGTIHGNPTWQSEELDFLQRTYSKDVVISNLFTKGDRSKQQADEYIEITNNSNSPADISGWQIIALKVYKERFVFPANTILEAGKSFRVYTNEYHPETGGFTFGFHTQMFKDSGEESQLLDLEGNLIDKYTY